MGDGFQQIGSCYNTDNVRSFIGFLIHIIGDFPRIANIFLKINTDKHSVGLRRFENCPVICGITPKHKIIFILQEKAIHNSIYKGNF